MLKLVDRAAAETDRKKQAELWKEYQVAMVDQANLIMLFQPVFRVGCAQRDQVVPADGRGLEGRAVRREARLGCQSRS
jgi:ABC-type transport system substrate-binding protein